MTFDPANPNKKLVKQVLYQVWGTDAGYGETLDMYQRAWCLRDMELVEYKKLEKYMIDAGLISPGVNSVFFDLTNKGRRVESGDFGPEDY